MGLCVTVLAVLRLTFCLEHHSCPCPPAHSHPPTPPSLPLLLQYLRFLLTMACNGCAPGQLPYVTVLDAVAVQVEPLGGGDSSLGGRGSQAESVWNLDGELLRGGGVRIAAEVHHGLLRVFSRGVEQ